MTATTTFDVQKVRADFPILELEIHGRPLEPSTKASKFKQHEVLGKQLVYLDNGASAQKPQCVIDAVRTCYERRYANIHRAVHQLSQELTDDYEEARRTAQRFINAPEDRECIFVRGATEGINLVAQSWGRANVKPGDEILITAMEHHSNIVPWQMLCDEKGAHLKVAPMDETGTLIIDEYEKLLSAKTKLVGIGHVSNALGTVNPIKRMAEAAHRVGAKVLIDGAQAAPHTRVDVQDLNVDFYTLSGHKVFGPTGVGVLWGRGELLEAMPPWQGGGDMIKSVSFERTEYNEIPHKFEAGTPNIAGGIGLKAALDYVSEVGIEAIEAYEHELVEYAQQQLGAIEGLRLIGTSPHKAGVVSFVLEDIHSTDAGMILDEQGIAIRSGHHCAEPVMDFFKVPGTMRASFAFYNTREEVDALVKGIHKVKELFA